MANRLTTTPKTWYPECKYCQITDMGHEKEILRKARKLCANHQTNHFLDYVNAELTTLDHSILNPITITEILVQIHDQVGCSCLSELSHQVSARITDTDIPPQEIPTIAKTPPTQTGNTTIRPRKSTLLDRIRNGQNGTTISRKT